MNGSVTYLPEKIPKKNKLRRGFFKIKQNTDCLRYVNKL